MIICPKCGKENQDHYKFCLGCGNELPRESGPKGPARPTPSAVQQGGAPRPASPFAPAPAPAPGGPFAAAASSPVHQAAPIPVVAPMGPPTPMASPAAPLPPPQPVSASSPSNFPPTCPQCASPNPRANRFCITCGYDMTSGSATATAPIAPMSPVAAPPVAAPPVAAPPVAAPPVAAAPVAAPPVAAAPVATPPAAAPLPPRAPIPAGAVERAKLVLIRPDGSEGASFTLHDGENPVGRDSGSLFTTDTYLSPRHATFSVSAGNITVRDEASLNGVYVRVERQQAVELRDGDIFRIGQEILRFEALHPVGPNADGTERLGAELEGLVGKVSLVTGRDTIGNAFPVPVMGIYLGRERGDILFPDDGYVSGLHCQLTVAGNRVSLLDVGSSNGTYVRLKAPRALRNGDFLLLGQQLFRLQMI